MLRSKQEEKDVIKEMKRVLLEEQRMREEKEFDAIKKAAEKGDPNAQIELAYNLERGLGTPKDEAKAVHWYRQAAIQEHPIAQCNLGIMLQFGRGATKNDAEAAEWYTKAAKQGIAKAQYNLGTMFKQGEGVAKNIKQAISYFTQAAEHGYVDGQLALARFHEAGFGIDKDIEQAIGWYRRAAEKGNSEAKYNLGRLLELKDETQAIHWYCEAANEEYEDAKYALAALLFKGKSVKNVKEAQRLVSEALKSEEANLRWTLLQIEILNADGGEMNPDTCFKIAQLYRRINFDVIAIARLRSAADQGHARAQCRLGRLHELGVENVLAVNKVQAFTFFNSAAQKGARRAIYHLGRAYEIGIGVTPDLKEATKHYQKASVKGDVDAVIALQRLEIIEKANNGDIDAQKILVRAFELGKDPLFGKVKNEEQAAYWKSKIKAAEEDPDADYHRGSSISL